MLYDAWKDEHYMRIAFNMNVY